MKKNAATFLLFLLSLLVINPPVFASNLLGPKKYLRTTGVPNVYTDTFRATSGQGRLTIKNGEEDGSNRVTSALILLNGVQLFGPSDFKKKTGILELSLELANNNDLVVELRSKPGSYLTIEVYQDPPTVSFSANPETVLLGQTCTLSWDTSLANTCTITPDVGDVDVSGSMTVTPTQTTTYTITATGAGGSASASAEVTVIPPPSIDFSVSPDTILEGDSTTLSWTTTHADTVTIDSNIGDVGLNGSMPVSPASPTTYTLVAIGPGGAATASVSVDVLYPPSAILQASPGSVHAGESATLSWITNHADSVSIDQGIGQVAAKGAITVSPSQTTIFTLTAVGPGGTTTTSTTVIYVNSAPVAQAQSVALDEDTQAGITLSGFDADNDNLTFSVVSTPAHGSLAGTAPNLTYSPAGDYHGLDSFTFTVNDGQADASPATVDITVRSINDAPVALDDSFSTDEGTALTTGDVLANDTDVDGDSLSVTGFTQAGNGTVTSSGAGVFIYAPNPGFSGIDSFTYTVGDGQGGTDTGSVTIEVIAAPPTVSVPDVSGQPQAEAETILTSAGLTTGTITTDESTTVPVGSVISQDPVAGTLVAPGSAVALTIAVAANHPPEITSTPPTTVIEGSRYTYAVKAADPDAADILTYFLDSAPSGMQISHSNGAISWTPAFGQSGVYPVTVRVTDNHGGVANQSFSITVTVTPSVQPKIISSPVTQAYVDALYAYDVEAYDANPGDQETLSFRLRTAPSGMTIQAASGLIQWYPNASQIGPHPVQVMVSDRTGQGSYQDFTVTVLPPDDNHTPMILSRPETAATAGRTYHYAMKAVDVDKDPLAYHLISAPDGMQINADTGAITWTPAENQIGFHKVKAIVSDGNGGSDADLYDLTVYPPGAVDLEPTYLDLTQSFFNPQTHRIEGTATVEIRNRGDGDIDNGYEVILYEDTNRDQIYSQGDTVLGVSQAAPPHNGGAYVNLTVPLDGPLTFRDNLVYALVDSNHSVEEADEANNLIHSKTACQYHPPVASFDPAVEWEWTGSDVVPDSNQILSLPVVASLNDDNEDGRIDQNDIPDIIFTTFDSGNYLARNVLRAVSGDGSGELFSVTDHNLVISSNVGVGDIDQDGLVEILAIRWLQLSWYAIVCFENDGTFKWQSETIYGEVGRFSSVNIYDLDQDGNPEVISDRVVLNSDGTLKWIGQDTPAWTRESIVVNLDNQGLPELLAGVTAYRANGDIYWRLEGTEYRSGDFSFQAVANFDDDPFPEIVAVSGYHLFLLEHTGEKVWQYPSSGYLNGTGGSPLIADLDGDGQPEIGIATADQYLVFEGDGRVKWSSTTQDISSARTGSSAFDFDGDGQVEVVYRDEEYLRIYRGSDGKILFQSDYIGSGTQSEYPLIVDVDNDNNAEIVVVSDLIYGGTTGIRVYGDLNDTWVNTRKIWNQHAYHITNVNDDGTIPRVMANSWEGLNNFRQNQTEDALGCQDVSASSLIFDQPAGSANATLTARIGNASALKVGPTLSIAFYHGDPDGGGSLIGTHVIDEFLEPGDYRDISIVWEAPPAGQLQIYVRADDDGTGRSAVSESDEENNTAYTVVFVGNYAPLAVAGDDQTVFINDTVLLDGGASFDPDGDALNYRWSIIQAPAQSTAALSDPASPAPELTPDQQGRYLLQLVVNDGFADSGVSQVAITVSPRISVPDLTALPQADARTLITDTGLTVGTVVLVNNAAVPAGTVVSQSPAPGTIVYQDSVVDITVSTGIAMVGVPDLVGLSRTEAESALSAAGLVTGSVSEQYSNLQPQGVVFDQAPAASTLVAAGTAVNLSVSLGTWTGPDTTPPRAGVSASPNIVGPGETAVITVWAFDDVGVIERVLTVDNEPVPLQGNQAMYSTQTPGGKSVTFTVTDAAGHTTVATASFGVSDPDDTAPPQVSFSLAGQTLEITEPTDIYGSVADPGLARYSLELAPARTTDWAAFASGNQPVSDSVLGRLDPTLLPNGVFTLRLTAEDFSGNIAHAQVDVMVKGAMKVGHFSFTIEDINIPLAGIPITVRRTYNTLNRNRQLDFGHGWSIDYQDVKIEENRSPGTDWQPWHTTGTYCVAPAGEHFVTSTLPDGRLLEFDVGLTPDCQSFVPILYTRPVFSARPGTNASLSVQGGTPQLFFDQTNGLLLDTAEMAPYDPSRYTLTTAEGYVYLLDQDFGITRVTDPNGNYLTYSSGGIMHSSGVGITFERDSEGRITHITDPQGHVIEYQYDDRGDLVQTVDATGEITSYVYDGQHRMTEYIDPRGLSVARNEYDDQGRLTAQVDADGNRVEFTHDIEGRQEVTRDRKGNVTVHVYDARGNILSKSDALGNTTTCTYDARDNQLTETDPLGNTETRTYDSRDNLLSSTDALGNTTTYTYDYNDRLLTTTDPKGNITTNTYDVRGNLIEQENQLGHVQTYTYDGSGRMLTSTDYLGQTTSYAYNAAGYLTRETDPDGNVTEYGYDANGNQVSTTKTRTEENGDTVVMVTSQVYDGNNRVIEQTDALGNTVYTEYNGIGKVSLRQDALGNITSYDYDSRGNLITTGYCDGTTETAEYDANNNKISATDRQGRTTIFGYDTLNRLVRTTYPDGSYATIEYDATGKIAANIDERGSRTEFDYDAIGRRTRTVGALGSEILFFYDENGNLLSATDANGHTTSYAYDDLNRRTITWFDDGTTQTLYYDALGRKIAEGDANGLFTYYDYDSAGRLIQVIDALGNTTVYTYDEQGNKLTQADANGHENHWRYDNLGRVLSHSLPLGQSESFTYDANGNQISHTDYNGDTTYYTYDAANGGCDKLSQKSYPDGTSVEYTYTATGKIATVSESSGTTVNTYDLRDRLIRVDHPDGSYLIYAYDAAGNRTEVTTPSDTTYYSFDALNRLAEVTAPDGGVTTYTYDAVGNRATVSLPNGVTTIYTYDNLNRLIEMVNQALDGSVLSSFGYTLGPAGNRLQVDEDSGRSVVYTYDELYRLTGEQIFDPVNGDREIVYTYDAVGNRLTRNIVGTAYSWYRYDNNDRMTYCSQPQAYYTYDDNGNQIRVRKLSDAQIFENTDYSYDHENRLISVTSPDRTLDYSYDAEGIRTATIADGVRTDYLVDKNRPYAQVLEEYDDTGFLVASYVYGDDLISQDRGGVSYYLYDGQLSTRQLTDDTGTVADTYIYDAFGSLTSQSGTTENNYLYTGEQYDPNVGFYYLRARYYDQSVGRFTAADPWQGVIFFPSSLHKYRYSNNNPITIYDPTGLVDFSLGSTLTAMSGNMQLRSISRLQYQAIGRRLAVKVGCIVIEEAIESAITEGVYILLDTITIGNKPYVGQSKNVIKRLKQHIGDKITDLNKRIAVFNLKGFSKTQREIFEQLVIDELGGIESVSNLRNPVGSKRKKIFKKAGRIFRLCR